MIQYVYMREGWILNMRRINPVICYCVILCIAFVVATHNETFVTAAMIFLWFAVPMIITYAIELFILQKHKKEMSIRSLVVAAIINTVIVFILCARLGIYVLTEFW